MALVNVLGHPGGTTAAELRALGVDPAQVLDLSVNVSPFGPSPRVLAAIHAADVVAYPDRQAAEARRALGSTLGVDPATLLMGNGAAELIWCAVRALARPGDRMVIGGPTFSEAEAAARAHGMDVVEVRASPRMPSPRPPTRCRRPSRGSGPGSPTCVIPTTPPVRRFMRTSCIG